MSTPKHFLNGLDTDLKENLLQELKVEWTHHSTGLEGNSLNLGETEYVLTEGLTVDGKPLKDHNEVIGHGKAIDWVMAFAGGSKNEADFPDLFELHRLVQTDIVLDVRRPYGAWKIDPNGTKVRDEHGHVHFIEFATPKDVPFLMEKWVADFNAAIAMTVPESKAPEVFSELHTGFTLIHPFWDGNGRMARLLANIPLLRSGLPPIVIQRTYRIREQYIRLLQEIQQELGTFSMKNAPIPIDNELLEPLSTFCEEQWTHALSLVKQAHDQQQKRND